MIINLNADQTIVETVIKEGETDAEYDEFLTILASHPAPVEGKRVVLQYPSYEWVLIDDDTPDEPESDELLDIITGVTQ